MGMISKRVHQRATNGLAEATRGVTTLDVDEVLDALRGVVDFTAPKTGLLSSGQKLWLFGAAPGPWSVFYGPPSRREVDKVVRVWRCEVSIVASSDGASTLVAVSLAQWKTTDGKLVARREFEKFRADFDDAVGAADPTYQTLV